MDVGAAVVNGSNSRGFLARLRLLFFGDPARRFAWVSLLLTLSLAVSPLKDFFRQWRGYQRQYASYIKSRPDAKALRSRMEPGIHQIWLPRLGVVDRCTTCHLGINEPTLAGASVPEPFRAHPAIPHNPESWGCTVCHRGQGPATKVEEAHEITDSWEQPILPGRFIQASCGTCHYNDLAQAPRLDRGRRLLARLDCTGCHKIAGIARPAMLAPDLTDIGTKVSREWIYKWLKEPRTITDANGNQTVDGVDVGEPRMPTFRLTDAELRDLSAYLSVQRVHPVQPYPFDPRVVAALAKRPDLADQGEARFRQMFCSTCHSLAVTRAGETTLIGGDIGPELTKVGSKVNPDWLVDWLRNPQQYLPNSQMPRYEWSDKDLYEVTQYMERRLTDPSLLADVPHLAPPTEAEIDAGRKLFTDKGCASCHAIQGIPAQKDFGPDLSTIGARNVSQLDFGPAKIPRTLTSYLEAKVSNPLSVNPAGRMPQYHLDKASLTDVTTALLSLTGPPPTLGMEKLMVVQSAAEFHPAGEFGKLYEQYKCYACHKFNGFGGTLAPDLSYEGSRARRAWMIQFMLNPQTVRPTLIFRMPQFNMSKQEATIIADYLKMVMQSPIVDPGVDRKQFTPAMAAAGKELYEKKYACQSCHTIGSAGGYVGPSLSSAGNWLTPGWIEAWLRNPQALVPGTIEPRRNFTSEEIQDLTAYILSLKQGSAPAESTAGAGAAASSSAGGSK